MRKVCTGSQLGSLPAANAAVGTPGYFNNAAPGLGVTPTVPGPDWFNVIQEELLSILAAASVAPDDSGGAVNQVLTAVQALITSAITAANSGRLLNVQTFESTSVYNATAGTNECIAMVVGGGGAGGGTTATGAGQCAAAAGGDAGAYALGRYSVSSLNGQTVTVGAGGTAVAGNAGGNGGTSSIGTVITASGGAGGLEGPALTPPFLTDVIAVTQTITGANIESGYGGPGMFGIAVNTTYAIGGAGGSSVISGSRSNGELFGAGGQGASALASSGAVAGTNGASGIVVIWEYS